MSTYSPLSESFSARVSGLETPGMGRTGSPLASTTSPFATLSPRLGTLSGSQMAADDGAESVWSRNMSELLSSGILADVVVVVDAVALPERRRELLSMDTGRDGGSTVTATATADGDAGADGGEGLKDAELPELPTTPATTGAEADVCGGGVEMDAHAAILGAHSARLRSELSGGVRGADGKWVVRVEGYAEGAVGAAIEYMYTGRVSEIDPEWVVDLLEFADAYELPVVAELAHLYIRDALDVDTVVRVWAAAHRFGNARVVEAAAAFVLDPANTERVLAVPDFVYLPEDVVGLLVTDTALPAAEPAVFDALARWLAANYPAYPATDDGHVARHAGALIEAVRFPLMTPEHIADVVEPTGLVPPWLVAEAYRYHATGRAPADGTNLRFHPRALP